MNEVLSSRRLAAFGLALACAFLGVCCSSAIAAPAVTGTFTVPGVEGNSKIVAGPDGNIWVTLAGATENVARITPAGAVKEFELKLSGTSGIAVGPEGKLWVTETEGVASFSPADPEGTVHATPIPAIKSFHSIVAGPEGRMWVATEEAVLRFSPSTPELPESKAVPGLSPRDIDVSGSLVIVADSGAPRIVTFTSGFVEQDYPYGAAGGSQGLAAAPGGQIAFSDQGATPEQIGLLTPPGPAQTFEQLGEPFGVTYGADGAFWFSQFAAGGVTRLTTTGQKTFLGGLPKESPRQIAAGPDDTLWVTLAKTGEEGVGRISGLEPPSVPVPISAPAPVSVPVPVVTRPVPQTTIRVGPKGRVKIKAKRAMVTFRFASSFPGASFECALVKAKKGKQPRQPAFKACSSPRRLDLRAGRYRFSVRALLARVADPTPATRSFAVVRRG